MALKINRNTNASYTYRDMRENKFQQLWEGAQKYMEHLTQVQTKVVEMLPKYKSLLPDEFAKLQGKEAQMNLLDYIRLKSIYTFADEAFNVLDKLCHDLVVAENAQDQEGIESNSFKIEALCKIPLDDLISDEVTGFQRLCTKWQDLRKESIITDWIVFNNKGRTWSFGDIVGTINSYALFNESLWRDATQNKDPEAVSVGKLLNSDEMIRIY